MPPAVAMRNEHPPEDVAGRSAEALPPLPPDDDATAPEEPAGVPTDPLDPLDPGSANPPDPLDPLDPLDPPEPLDPLDPPAETSAVPASDTVVPPSAPAWIEMSAQ
jgi:hypothetical protein